MTFKELVRASMNGETEDIKALTEEAELFGGDPRIGARLKELFTALAQEKLARLKELGRIFKEGTGFRQRALAPARSVEAALRAHVTRSEQALKVYADLVKQLNKPEFKEALSAMLLRERACLAGIRELQAGLKRPQEK
ncbi:MAG: hypothetical protein NDI60_08275 [Elusimicrobiales bacterium]|nr:hypothetical protein [Elusimicrobiales bacterium]